MTKQKILSIDQLLREGEEATVYNNITREILREEAERLRAIPKQADK